MACNVFSLSFKGREVLFKKLIDKTGNSSHIIPSIYLHIIIHRLDPESQSQTFATQSCSYSKQETRSSVPDHLHWRPHLFALLISEVGRAYLTGTPLLSGDCWGVIPTSHHEFLPGCGCPRKCPLGWKQGRVCRGEARGSKEAALGKMPPKSTTDSQS